MLPEFGLESDLECWEQSPCCKGKRRTLVLILLMVSLQGLCRQWIGLARGPYGGKELSIV